MRRSIILPILLSALVLASCQATGGGKKKKPKTEDKVTGVSLNRDALNFNLNPNHLYDHEQLVATVEGEGEYSKEVSWSTSNSGVAKVDNGYVVAVGLGEATITAVSVEDDSFSATCSITVIDDVPVVTGVTLTPSSSTIDLKNENHTLRLVAKVEGLNAPSQEVTWESNDTSKVTVSDTGLVTALEKTNGVKITATSKENNQYSAEATITVVDTTPRVTKVEIQKNSLTITQLDLDLYEGKNALTAQLSAKVSGENDYSQDVTWSSDDESKVSVDQSGLVTAKAVTYPSVNIYATSKMDPSVKATLKVVVKNSTPEVTSVTVSPNETKVGIDKTVTLVATVNGNNLTTEAQKTVTWTSDSTFVKLTQKDYRTVEVTGIREGTGIQVRATSTFNTNAYGVCNIDVVEQVQADYTIMIYMCGSDLESNNGFATSDIGEILSLSNKPEGVNIIFETGGARTWKKYNISNSKLERYHVENKSIVRDEQLTTYSSMGNSSTFQSFLEWGLQNYPANKTGLIMWNHGGGMDGCCYDEKQNYDSLTTPEMRTALSKAFTNCNLTGQKLEWIGYDCCLMQAADNASIMSDYFHYMVASQESESGEGWDYDNWLDNLYANVNIDTNDLMKEICDTFVKDNGGDVSSNNQVLSYLKLDNMASFITAFNDWSSSYNSSSGFTSVNSAFSSALKFSSGDYGSVDMKSILKELSVSDSSILMNTLNNLVGYSRFSSKYSTYKTNNPCGVNAFVASSNVDPDYRVGKSAYSTSASKFTNWQKMNYSYGSFY